MATAWAVATALATDWALLPGRLAETLLGCIALMMMFGALGTEAAKLVKADPEKAADIYLRTNKSKVDRALLLKVIKNPEVDFKLTPEKTLPLADFMHRIGAIKNKPLSVKDYFFDDAHVAQGS